MGASPSVFNLGCEFMSNLWSLPPIENKKINQKKGVLCLQSLDASLCPSQFSHLLCFFHFTCTFGFVDLFHATQMENDSHGFSKFVEVWVLFLCSCPNIVALSVWCLQCSVSSFLRLSLCCLSLSLFFFFFDYSFYFSVKAAACKGEEFSKIVRWVVFFTKNWQDLHLKNLCVSLSLPESENWYARINMTTLSAISLRMWWTL